MTVTASPTMALPCALCGTPARGTCPSCGLTPLQQLPVGIVGRVAAVKGEGKWLPAIVLAPQPVDSTMIRVLCAGEAEPRLVAAECLQPQRMPGTQHALSPAGAVLRCIGATAQASGFDDGTLRELAIAAAGDGEPERVLLALDAAAIGDEIAFEGLALREPVRTLVRANVLVAQGRVPEPSLSDPSEKPNPLMRSLYLLQAGGALSAGIPIADAHPMLAHDPMVRLAMEAGHGAATVETLQEAIALSSSGQKSRVEDLLGRWRSDRSIAVCRDIAPTAMVLHGLTRATKGAQIPEDVLVKQTAVIVDTLIDKGFITAAALPRMREAWPHDAAYWGARLDPTVLSDDECLEVGLSAEVARRLIEADPNADVSRFAGDPQVDAVLAARAYLAGDDAAFETYRRVRAPEDCESLTDLRELMEGNYRGLPPTHLLEERTLWPTIAEGIDETFLEQTASAGEGMAAREFVAWASLRLALAQLQVADWPGVERNATRSLRCASQEAVADEALNLRAIGRWLSGNAAGAIADLEEALQGEYGPGLVANSVIVALSEHSQRQGALLARTIELAPSPMDAGHTAVFIAQQLRRDSESQGELPYEIVTALRSVLVKDIRKDDFRSLLEVLSDVDADWLANATLNASPHAKSAEAEIYRAKAEGIFEWVAALVHHRKVKQPWLESMAQSVALVLCMQLMQEGTQEIAADLGLQLLDGKVPLPPESHAQLTALTIREIAFLRGMTPTLRATPGWLEESRLEQFLRVGLTISSLDAGVADYTREIYDACARGILGAYAQTLQTLAQVLTPMVFGNVAQQFRSIFSSIEKSSAVPIDVKQQAGELRRMLG